MSTATQNGYLNGHSKGRRTDSVAGRSERPASRESAEARDVRGFATKPPGFGLTPEQQRLERRARVIVPGLVIGLLSINAGITFVMVRASMSDRQSAAVEPNYYEQGMHYNDTSAALARSAALGWTIRCDATAIRASGLSGGVGRPGEASGQCLVRVTLADRAGEPVRGCVVEAEAFAQARAGERRRLRLEATATPGEYAVLARLEPAGMWELRLKARRGTEQFVSTERLRIAPLARELSGRQGAPVGGGA